MREKTIGSSLMTQIATAMVAFVALCWFIGWMS